VAAAPPERPAPIPLLVLAALHAGVACVLVVLGLPAIVAALVLAVLAATQVAVAEGLALRVLGAHRPEPVDADAFERTRRTLEVVAAAAGLEVPALLVAGRHDAPAATSVARSRRDATIVVDVGVLTASPARRETTLARACAEIELGESVVRTVASVPAALRLPLLTRVLLAPGSRRRETAVADLTDRVVDVVRSGAPSCPAVPYREFLKA